MSFIARAHPPVLFMKCIASNQNLFDFHPCLAHEARCGTRFLAEVLLPEQFKGDEGRWIKEKRDREEGTEEDRMKKEERGEEQ